MPSERSQPQAAGLGVVRGRLPRAPWWLPRDPVGGVRVAGVLSMAGAAYEVLGHLLDPSAVDGRPWGWAVVLGGSAVLFLLALGPALAPRRVPRWSAALLALLAMTLVLALGLTARDISFDTQVALGWVPLYGAYHFGRRGAWTVTAIALVYEAVLLTALAGTAQAVQEGLAFAATFGVTTWLLSAARDRTGATVDTLRQLAERDPLTGLASRRVLDDALAAACVGTVRAVLLLVDVDHFKEVNDSAGHTAGDEVLRAVATVLREESRAGDLPARYGGDELAVLLPGASSEGAARVAERIRVRVAELAVPVPDDPARRLSVTVSIGLGHRVSSGDVRDLVADADHGLYAAKRAGRNRVGVLS